MWIPNKYHKIRKTAKSSLLLKETPVDWSETCLWVAWIHHLSLPPLCFSADFTAAKWKRQPVRGRDVMTFPWMMFTKSKKQQYAECQHGDIWFPFRSCGITTGTPADITVLPRLVLGLSAFSFHFNVFRNNTHFPTPCNATAASWYFDYLHEVWLNKGDSVSVTFSISSWRQTGKRNQSSAHRTWGDC